MFAALITLTLMLCVMNFAFNQNTIRAITEQEGDNLVSAIEQHANNVLASIFRLSRRAAYHQENYFGEWQEDVLNYINHYDGLDSALFVEPDGQIRWFVNMLGPLPKTQLSPTLTNQIAEIVGIKGQQIAQKYFSVLQLDGEYMVLYKSPIFEMGGLQPGETKGYIIGLTDLSGWFNQHLRTHSDFLLHHELAIQVAGFSLAHERDATALFPVSIDMSGQILEVPYHLTMEKTEEGVAALGLFNTLFWSNKSGH